MMGILMMDSMERPYDSFDCLLFESEQCYPIMNVWHQTGFSFTKITLEITVSVRKDFL